MKIIVTKIIETTKNININIPEMKDEDIPIYLDEKYGIRGWLKYNNLES